MVAPVEIGEGGVELLVGNGLLKQHQADGSDGSRFPGRQNITLKFADGFARRAGPVIRPYMTLDEQLHADPTSWRLARKVSLLGSLPAAIWVFAIRALSQAAMIFTSGHRPMVKRR